MASLLITVMSKGIFRARPEVQLIQKKTRAIQCWTQQEMINGLSRVEHMVSNYNTFMKQLHNYFLSKVHSFETGRLKHFAREWQCITSGQYILETVTGVKLEYVKASMQQEAINAKFDAPSAENIHQEIQSLLKKGVVTEFSDSVGKLNPYIVAGEKGRKV